MKTALLVDGPRAGARYEVADNQPSLILPLPIDEDRLASYLLGESLPWATTFEQIVYNLYHGAVWIGGYSLTLGSVRAKPHLEDLIEVVLSEEAKEALR